MWASVIAGRLRELRQRRGVRQDRIASALSVSVSEISRLERAIRGLRVDQIYPWAEALGHRAELVMWEGPELDEHGRGVLAAIAAALPNMPPEERQELLARVNAGRAASS